MRCREGSLVLIGSMNPPDESSAWAQRIISTAASDPEKRTPAREIAVVAFGA
jgi:hypothetical protein